MTMGTMPRPVVSSALMGVLGIEERNGECWVRLCRHKRARRCVKGTGQTARCPSCRGCGDQADISSSNGSTFSVTFALRSEEHTSELQSQSNLVCRLLLEKKNTNHNY